MANPNLITLTEPKSAAAEAYRTLQTNLMFRSVEKPIQTLLVTSPVDGEGKSDAVANLAVTFAQDGNITILVDADLSRPSLHNIWGVKNRGITTMMLDDSAMANPPLVDSGGENLLLLPAGEGAPNPANYILFDSPPVLAPTDAALLGIKLNGVLFVVKSEQSRRDQTTAAREALEQVHVRVVGAVLTNSPRENRKAN